MRDDTLGGGFADPPVDAAHAFRAALSALARPGRIETLSGGRAPAPVSPAAAALLLTLCDTETPLCLAPSHDTPAIRDWIAFHTGAPIVPASEAQFALGRWSDLPPLHGFPAGTADYPDRSTTLIVELDRLATQGARLTGPGIETATHLSLPATQPFRDNRALFPLGLDFYFTCGTSLAGLPRSTNVEDA